MKATRPTSCAGISQAAVKAHALQKDKTRVNIGHMNVQVAGFGDAIRHFKTGPAKNLGAACTKW
tara:strand:- start:177 stop:368 length:192 start_codon:yes stop_codon:yes gene_type:complete